MPPFILDWSEFCDYLVKMKQLPLIEGVDNFYWDIRPRPEFGTIELRVCDTPLSVERAIQIAAFAQSLAHYLLEERTALVDDKHDLHRYNRFQASKLGFNSSFINPMTFQEHSLLEDLLETCRKIEPYSKALHTEELISVLISDVIDGKNDSAWLQKLFSEGEDLKDIVYLSGHLFTGKINHEAFYIETAA